MTLLYNGYCYSRVLCEKGFNYIYQAEIKRYIETDRIYGKNGGILTSLYNLTMNSNHIVNSLYLGNAYNARDYYSLKNNNIGMIVNCTIDVDNYFEDTNEFEYVRVDVYDNNEASILKYLDNTVDSINDFLTKNPHKNILVHCFMGSSRSATIIIAYMIKYLNYTRREALSYIKNKRDIVNLNINFFKELKKYENSLKNSSNLYTQQGF